MPKSITDRLYARSTDVGECREFIGYRDRKGYGQIGVGQRVFYAHRLAWEVTFGPIPPGILVCHKCDNPSCIRPSHLFLGTHLDNSTDRDVKGRTFNGQAVKTHCKHGHEFTPENTYFYKDGRGRQCRACWSARDARRRAKLDRSKLSAYLNERFPSQVPAQ